MPDETAALLVAYLNLSATKSWDQLWNEGEKRNTFVKYSGFSGRTNNFRGAKGLNPPDANIFRWMGCQAW